MLNSNLFRKLDNYIYKGIIYPNNKSYEKKYNNHIKKKI